MTEYTQYEFDASEFIDNPEPRCACVLLLDTSGSMSGQPIAELNAGLQVFHQALTADGLAAKRVEVAIITFGPVEVKQDFANPTAMSMPMLRAADVTPMGEAITRAVDLVEARKRTYKSSGIAYYRPWIFLITDGAPTDGWQAAAAAVRQGEEEKRFMFFAVGVQGADMGTLRKISVREPLSLRGLEFSKLFTWLSSSLGSVSRSSTGDTIALENPTTPSGWAQVG